MRICDLTWSVANIRYKCTPAMNRMAPEELWLHLISFRARLASAEARTREFNRNFRFGPITRASYASPVLDATSLPPEQTPSRPRRSEAFLLSSDAPRLLPRRRPTVKAPRRSCVAHLSAFVQKGWAGRFYLESIRRSRRRGLHCCVRTARTIRKRRNVVR